MKIRSLVLISFFLLVSDYFPGTECRRSGGGGRTSSHSYHSSHSSRPSQSSHSGSSGSSHSSQSSQNSHSSSSGNNQGWQSSGSTSHTNTQGNTNYGWQRPGTNTNSNPSGNSGSNYGWKKPDSQGSSHPDSHTQTQTGNKQSTPTGGANHGWQKPPDTHSNKGGTNTHTQTQTQTGNKPPTPPGGTNYGWQKPPETHSNPSGTNYGWKRPDSGHQDHSIPKKETQTNTGNIGRPGTNSYHPSSGGHHASPPSSNIGPGGYPVQQGSNKYYSGYNHGYQSGYSNGYNHAAQSHTAQPSQYGFTPTYYPSHNSFGYPGQGIYGGHGGPSYAGMSVYGGNGHYGYPSSGSWNYPSYGTGSSSSGVGNVLAGALVGYHVHSLLHSATSPNPWGYSGHGYGSGYNYVTVDRRTFVTHNYNNNTTTKGEDNRSGSAHWIQCVAFDPTTQTTLINPNCSCTVTDTIDPTTNVSTSVHNCTTSHGHQTETTPKRYAEEFDMNAGSKQSLMPSKYYHTNLTRDNDISDVEKQKKEILGKLERMVQMGSFTS